MKLNLSALLTAAALTAVAFASAEIAAPAPMGEELTARYPYSMAGQVIFTSGDADYQGTATVVHRRSVLTAAHNLWDVRNGWSTNVEFNRARAGAARAHHSFANRLFVYAGYQGSARRFGADSLRAFVFDLGGLRFPAPLADGAYASWRADYRSLTNASYKIALGYGAERHTGDDLLFVEPTESFSQIYSAFFEAESLSFEGGMSGGPVFADIGSGELRLVAVVVAGSNDPPTGGIRAINPAAARFLNTYLRY